MTTTIGVTEPRKLAGQSVDWVRISDNAYNSIFAWYGIASNAPHPNAAKLYVDFIFSKEGQQIQEDTGGGPVMPGLRRANPDTNPEGMKLIPIELQSDADRKAFLAKYPALA